MLLLFGGVHVATSFPGAGTNPIDLRFPGQWFQAESGLHQNWMRDYDPTTGRHVRYDRLERRSDLRTKANSIRSERRHARHG
jgi:RHS repeat-associated protein